MSASTASVGHADLVREVGAELVQDHGTYLLGLAATLLADPTAARRVVDEVVARQAGELGRRPWASPGADRGALTRLVLLRCGEAYAARAVPPGWNRRPAAMRWLDDVLLRQRMVVALCGPGEHSCREAARVLGLTPGTVLALLRAALTADAADLAAPCAVVTRAPSW